MSDEISRNRPQRMLLGILILLLVDVIWVSSSELTKYLYQNETYEKPFFTTYVKTSLFTIYLLGLCCWPPWRDQCFHPHGFTLLDTEDENIESRSRIGQTGRSLSDPQFVPIKKADPNSGTESDDSSVHSVRFNRMTEVRHMSSVDATDALIARLSYQASVRAGSDFAWLNANKLPMGEVAKIACTFCCFWFAANYTFQLSLKATEAGLNTVLSSSSGLFTLILTAFYPANNADKFSVIKLITVICSIIGLAVSCYTNFDMNGSTVGALLAISSAFFYAVYLVLLRKKVDKEEKLDIPLFFGFVGFFNVILMWPLFFILHYTHWEEFEWPNKQQWLLILVNGVIGTVFSEVLWLWGCYLTSSLVATMAISLTIPMSMLADVIVKETHYPIMFYVGLIPTLLSFTAITLITHYDSFDNNDERNPFVDVFTKLCQYISSSFILRKCRRLSSSSFRENLKSSEDSEQAEALINSENHHEC